MQLKLILARIKKFQTKMSQGISQTELSFLREWLIQHNLSTTKLHRSFSDAVNAANLLKQIHPRLVELHNYSRCSGYSKKLSNWQTLNTKVLAKLNLQRHQQELENYAMAKPGAIDKFLYDLMMQNLAKQVNDLPNDCDYKVGAGLANENVITIAVNKKQDDGSIVQIPQKMILFAAYAQIKGEWMKQKRLINDLQQKVIHLESLLKMKQQHIEELHNRLTQLYMQDYLVDCSSDKTIPTPQRIIAEIKQLKSVQ